MRSSTWLPVLVLLVGLGIGRDASAGAKMDWSEYLEPAGSRPPAKVATATQRPAKASASQRKASRTVAKKQSAKKAKRSVRSKRRR